MSQEIRINYEEVYAKTAELRQRIQSELQDMEATYRQTTSTLNQMDSRTNAVLLETMEQNRAKSLITAETLNKLLSFIDASAQQVERDEAMMTRAFTISRTSTTTPSAATPRNGGRV